MFRRFIDWLRLLLHLGRFMRSEVYRKADAAVAVVSKDQSLRALGELESIVSFCQRCGQRPQYDIRHDEAFSLAYGNLPPSARRRDLHFALELAHYLRRR